MATVVVLGALDTKGEEVRFLSRQIQDRGHKVLVVDVGVLGQPAFAPFITRDEVATAAGASLATLVAEADRGRAVTAMSRGATVVVQRMLERGQLDAVIAMGGGAGTSIGTAAMRALPLGIPKVMVSTLASGDVRLDLLARCAWRGERFIDLPSREFALLEYFMRHAGRVLSRQAILADVWGYDYDAGSDSNLVDVYVRYVRNKIAQTGTPPLIATVRGEGYRFDPVPSHDVQSAATWRQI